MPSLQFVIGLVLALASLAGLGWVLFSGGLGFRAAARSDASSLDRFIGFSILQNYVLGEALGPILLSALALSFFLLVKVVYQLIALMLAGGAGSIIVQMLLTAMPGIVGITVPIAIMVGVLLGIGRMAVEGEIRACQTAGVNLLLVVWPLIAMCALLSVGMAFMNYEITPRLDREHSHLKTQMTYQALRSIPPGYATDPDDYKMDRNPTIFYYANRDPKNQDMLHVCMLMQKKSAVAVEIGDLGNKSGKSAEDKAQRPKGAGRARASKEEAVAPDPPVSPFGGAWAADPPRSGSARPSKSAVRAKTALSATPDDEKTKSTTVGREPERKKSSLEENEGEPKRKKPGSDAREDGPERKKLNSGSDDDEKGFGGYKEVVYEKTRDLIFAERGRIVTDPATQSVSIILENGSIQSLGRDLNAEDIKAEAEREKEKARGKGSLAPAPASKSAASQPEPEENGDEVIRFAFLTKTIEFGGDRAIKSEFRVAEYTAGEMLQALSQGPRWAGWDVKDHDKVPERKRSMAVELTRRTAVSLACLSFGLLGIPLAIFVRPSGKSIGVAVSFGLILIYYWMINMGASMAKEGSDLGFWVILLPNLLMAGLGIFLLRRAVRM